MTETLPLVSVVVPVYNVEKYLEQCVESIVNQTYKNLEIILVDDGSTDYSPIICDAYARKDSRVHVIHQKNQGVVVARKTGYLYAKGEYLGTVDSDDWIEPDMFAVMLEKIRELSVDFVSVGYYVEYGRQTKANHQSNEHIDLSGENAGKLVLATLKNQPRNLVFMQWSKLVKADVQKKVYAAIPDYLRTGDDDLNFFYLLFHAKSAFQIGRAYYHYRIAGESLSHNLTSSTFNNYLSLICERYMVIRKLFPVVDKDTLDTLSVTTCISLLGRFKRNLLKISIYEFPCLNTIRGKTIIIYGAGKVGESYVHQFSLYEDIKIKKWIDRNHSAFCFDYRKVEAVETVKEVPFDYVIVAVLRKNVADEISKELQQYGVAREKILWNFPSMIINSY